MEALGMRVHLATRLLELLPEIIPESIADRIVMADRGTNVAPNLWEKARHQRLRSKKTFSQLVHGDRLDLA